MKILAIGDFHGKFPDKLKRLIRDENSDLILSNGDYAGIDDFRPALTKMFKMGDKGKRVSVEEILGEKRYNQLLKKDYEQGKMPIRELNKFRIPVLSVFGNGDWYKWEFGDKKRFYEKFVSGLKFVKNIHKKKTNMLGLKFVGFGGYIDNDIYLSKKYVEEKQDDEGRVEKRRKRYDKEEKQLQKLMKDYPDILLGHYTPFGCLDVMKEKGYYVTGKHLGVSIYNRAIEKYKPMLMVCGHMHENQGQCMIGRTLVINPGAACDGKAAVIEIDEKKKRVLSVRFVK